MSTDEKLGALALLALEPLALGDDEEAPDELLGEEDEPPEALLGEDDEEPEALGVDDEAPLLLLGEDDLSLALGVELLPLAPVDEELELWASEAPASAKSAAAVAVVTTFRTM